MHCRASSIDERELMATVGPLRAMLERSTMSVTHIHTHVRVCVFENGSASSSAARACVLRSAGSSRRLEPERAEDERAAWESRRAHFNRAGANATVVTRATTTTSTAPATVARRHTSPGSSRSFSLRTSGRFLQARALVVCRPGTLGTRHSELGTQSAVFGARESRGNDRCIPCGGRLRDRQVLANAARPCSCSLAALTLAVPAVKCASDFCGLSRASEHSEFVCRHNDTLLKCALSTRT